MDDKDQATKDGGFEPNTFLGDQTLHFFHVDIQEVWKGTEHIQDVMDR